MSESAVVVDRLTHRYGDRTALDAFSLEVPRGSIFGLLGPNGSGKTTLFRILATLAPVQEGTVRICGVDVAADPREVRRHIGVVFQSPSLDLQLTAAENLTHHGHLYGLRGAELKHRVAEALAAAGLAERAGDRTAGFSGGMRRRVELAKGLLHRPRLLLMDEPSTGLDPTARIDMWREIKNVAAAGDVTILLTTHLMEEADRCTRLAIMRSGRLVAADTPSQLKSAVGGDVVTIKSQHLDALTERISTQFHYTPIRLDDALRLELTQGHDKVPQIVEAAPGLIDSISVSKPTLEDVFIRLTGRQFE